MMLRVDRVRGKPHDDGVCTVVFGRTTSSEPYAQEAAGRGVGAAAHQ
jgi:hypothetical protein